MPKVKKCGPARDRSCKIFHCKEMERNLLSYRHFISLLNLGCFYCSSEKSRNNDQLICFLRLLLLLKYTMCEHINVATKVLTTLFSPFFFHDSCRTKSMSSHCQKIIYEFMAFCGIFPSPTNILREFLEEFTLKQHKNMILIKILPRKCTFCSSEYVRDSMICLDLLRPHYMCKSQSISF